MPKDNNIDSDIEMDVESAPIIKKPRPPRVASQSKTIKAPKPSLEGINTSGTSDIKTIKPKSAAMEPEEIFEPIDFNDDNSKLIPRQTVERKHFYLKRIFVTGLILFILVGAAYEVYNWHLKTQVAGYLGNFPSLPPVAINPLAQPTATSTALTTGIATSTPNSASGSIANSPFPLAGGSTPPATATSTVSSTQASQLTINSTPTGYLNVRSQPSTSSAAISQVHPNETYTYTASQNGWYQIILTNGQQGWVSGQYVTLVK